LKNFPCVVPPAAADDAAPDGFTPPDGFVELHADTISTDAATTATSLKRWDVRWDLRMERPFQHRLTSQDLLVALLWRADRRPWARGSLIGWCGVRGSGSHSPPSDGIVNDGHLPVRGADSYVAPGTGARSSGIAGVLPW
jgi:hypothetical protein